MLIFNQLTMLVLRFIEIYLNIFLSILLFIILFYIIWSYLNLIYVQR